MGAQSMPNFLCSDTRSHIFVVVDILMVPRVPFRQIIPSHGYSLAICHSLWVGAGRTSSLSIFQCYLFDEIYLGHGSTLGSIHRTLNTGQCFREADAVDGGVTGR